MSNTTIVIEKTITLSPDHPSFKGHFPGFPIYPGVSQIQDVCDSLSEYFGQTVSLQNISRTKFLAFITPPATLHITCRVDRDDIAWNITRDGNKVCVGRGKMHFLEGQLAP